MEFADQDRFTGVFVNRAEVDFIRSKLITVISEDIIVLTSLQNQFRRNKRITHSEI
ncbi:hypothetical protein D3C74_414050 [compost metagenome]